MINYIIRVHAWKIPQFMCMVINIVLLQNMEVLYI